MQRPHTIGARQTCKMESKTLVMVAESDAASVSSDVRDALDLHVCPAVHSAAPLLCGAISHSFFFVIPRKAAC